jgi:hypothetical protein
MSQRACFFGAFRFGLNAFGKGLLRGRDRRGRMDASAVDQTRTRWRRL